MNRNSLLLAAAALLLSAALFVTLQPATPTATAADAEKTGLFVNLTSGMDDLHSVSMGLSFAAHTAEMGRPVVVFVNVHAPVLAAKDLSENVKMGDFAPVRELLQNVVAKGGKVYVCAHCATLCGVGKDDLADGMIWMEGHHVLINELPAGLLGVTY